MELMTTSIAKKVESLGYRLPPVSAPAGSYVSTVQVQNLLFVSGQISLQDGKPAFLGQVGAEIDVEQGREAARAAGLGVLAQIAAAAQDRIAAVRRVAKLSVFVASSPDFARQPEVANGASDLMVAVFGEKGRHARAAVGVAALPRGVAVEVEAVVELEG
jgi:enamine deaminase RidA (YjgF/YER057c/UK114 family)